MAECRQLGVDMTFVYWLKMVARLERVNRMGDRMSNSIRFKLSEVEGIYDKHFCALLVIYVQL